jgi:hypothetical protein
MESKKQSTRIYGAGDDLWLGKDFQQFKNQPKQLKVNRLEHASWNGIVIARFFKSSSIHSEGHSF